MFKNHPLPGCAGILILFITLAAALQAQIPVDADGWSVFTPSADTRIYYVDDVAGDNATGQAVAAGTVTDPFNPGAEIKPFRTIQAAAARMRDGYPDWVLLRRGGVWVNESLDRFKNGRSASEPTFVGTYGPGNERPLIKVNRYFVNHDGHERNYQAFHGLEIYGYTDDPASPDFSGDPSHYVLRFVGGGDSILVEDCKLRFVGITVEGYAGRIYTNFKLRRSIITDGWYGQSSFNNESRPSGIYVTRAEGVLIEENLFDHNGWNSDVPEGGANAYNHNIYIQYENTGVVVVGNILSRASSHGIQLRSGGVLHKNLGIRNSIGMTVGSEIDAADARDNVILEGKRMDPNDGNQPRTAAVIGLEVHNASPGSQHYSLDNIVAHRWQSGSNEAYHYDAETLANAEISGNIAYKWSASQDDPNPGWADPERTIASYQASLGMPADTVAFIEAARNRRLGEMPWAYTAYAVINYIREGFNKESVAVEYDFADPSPLHVLGIEVFPEAIVLNGAALGQLTATVSPSNATLPSVIWSTSNADVATVDRFGRVSAVSEGTATITATTVDGGHTDSATVTVSALPVTGVSLDVEALSLNLGQENQLVATIEPANASVPDITWASSDAGVATVSTEGLVSAIGPGTAIITVTTLDGGFTAEVVVTVEALMNVALGKPVISDSEHSASAGAQAVVDGNSLPADNSRWVSADTAWPHWLEIDLEGTYAISQLRFWSGSTGLYRNPFDYIFQYWDGAAWVDVVSRTGNQDAIVDEHFEPVIADRVRLYGTGGTGNLMRVFEVEVYGVSTWEGYPVSEGYAHAGTHFLGWVYVTIAPWVFSPAMDGWIYFHGSGFKAQGGAWGYFNAFPEFSDYGHAPWVYSWDLNTWSWVEGFSEGATSGWVWITHGGD